MRKPCFLLLVLVLAFAGCGKKMDYSKVTEASPEQMEFVKSGLLGNLKIVKFAALKSTSHKKAWYVGALLTGPGLGNGEVGVWLISGDKKSPGMIKGVGGIAGQFSEFPKDDAATRDREYKIVKSYLNQ